MGTAGTENILRIYSRKEQEIVDGKGGATFIVILSLVLQHSEHVLCVRCCTTYFKDGEMQYCIYTFKEVIVYQEVNKQAQMCLHCERCSERKAHISVCPASAREV